MLVAGNTTGFVRNICLFIIGRILNFILSNIVSLIWTSTAQSGYIDVDSGLSNVLAGLMLRVIESEYAQQLMLPSSIITIQDVPPPPQKKLLLQMTARLYSSTGYPHN